MADDEQHISRGSDGGRSSGSKSRKDKPNKVPQRGLGVAQLEKIRMAEQKARDAIDFFNIRPSFSPSPNPIPLPPPPPPPPPIYLPIPQALLRPASLLPRNSEIMPQGLISIPNSSPPYGTWPIFSGGEDNAGVESTELNRNVLPYDRTAAAFCLPIVPYRPHHPFHQVSSSSSMVKPSGGVSQVSQRTQMELPSNQIFRSSNYKPSPEKDKMVGIKRPYPFSLESSPSSSLNRKFDSTNPSSVSKSDELVSSGNPYLVHLEQRDKNTREGAPNSSPHPSRSSVVAMHRGELTRDFLTLATPGAAAPLANPDGKKSYSELTHLKEKTEEQAQRQGEGAGESPAPTPFNFFPIEPSTSNGRSNDQNEDKIDLNLKL